MKIYECIHQFDLEENYLGIKYGCDANDTFRVSTD